MRSVEANIAHLLVGRHVAAGRGGDTAVIDDDGSWSFADLDLASGRVARALRAAGIRAGDRVAIVLPDGRDWCAAFLGAVRMGAVAAPLEPGGRHLERTLAAYEPAATIGETAGPGGGVRIDASNAHCGEPDPPAAVAPDALAYMIFSSGSTGAPKGAMHAHRDLIPSIEGYSAHVLGLGPGDRTFSVARLFASLGFGNGFFRPLGRGATAVLSRRRPTVRQVLDVVTADGVTVLSAVPTFWAQLATFLERHPDAGDLSGVRLAVSSGDSLPSAVLERIAHRTGLHVIEGFGCSECSNVVLSVRPGEHLPGTVGRVVPGAEVKLADAEGETVPSGSPGRLWIRTPSNTTGYWRRPDETADLVRGNWIRLGDVMREDGGVYRHLGRSDDLFKVDGRWVSPVEVEAALHEHPAVATAAVVGRADRSGIMRVAAYLESSGPRAPEVDTELRRLVARRVAPSVAPATIIWMDELPRGATGKVDRRALRAADEST